MEEGSQPEGQMYTVHSKKGRKMTQFSGQGLFSCFQHNENTIPLGLYMVSITILFKHYMVTQGTVQVWLQDLGNSSSERKDFVPCFKTGQNLSWSSNFRPITYT